MQEDYERAGRWLDGEEIDLTPTQLALAGEIAADAAKVGRALEVPLPGGALHRVSARLKRARRRGRARPMRWVAAAAAAAVVGVGLLALLTGGRNRIEPAEYVEWFLQSPSGELDARAALLADELAEYQVQLTLGEEWPVEVTVKGLEQQLGEFILEEADPAEPSAWEQWEESL
ncbi:MAG: hypothetical protein AMJ81_02605 [Phycisphaerae bacterium SM23_33]|nr:MAG: hypothetical protein AMJ81_02605 [Phycisphaerae bacterium SM23_33]